MSEPFTKDLEGFFTKRSQDIRLPRTTEYSNLKRAVCDGMSEILDMLPEEGKKALRDLEGNWGLLNGMEYDHVYQVGFSEGLKFAALTLNIRERGMS